MDIHIQTNKIEHWSRILELWHTYKNDCKLIFRQVKYGEFNNIHAL